MTDYTFEDHLDLPKVAYISIRQLIDTSETLQKEVGLAMTQCRYVDTSNTETMVLTNIVDDVDTATGWITSEIDNILAYVEQLENALDGYKHEVESRLSQEEIEDIREEQVVRKLKGIE